MLWYPRQETTGFITVFHYVSLVSCFESFVMWRANILLEWAWLNTGAKTIPRTHQLVSDRTDNVSLCFVCYLLAHCPSPTSFLFLLYFDPVGSVSSAIAHCCSGCYTTATFTRLCVRARQEDEFFSIGLPANLFLVIRSISHSFSQL